MIEILLVIFLSFKVLVRFWNQSFAGFQKELGCLYSYVGMHINFVKLVLISSLNAGSGIFVMGKF